MQPFLMPPPVIALFDVSGMEFMVIVFIALMLFGGKLPDIARNMGRTIAEFKRHAQGFTDEMRDVMDDRPRKSLRPPGPPPGKSVARQSAEPVKPEPAPPPPKVEPPESSEPPASPPSPS